MEILHNDKDLIIRIGNLKDTLYGNKVDFTEIYNNAKNIFYPCTRFYPFSVVFNEKDTNKKDVDIGMISFVDGSFKEFKIYNPITIYILARIKDYKEENLNNDITKIVSTLDMSKLLKGIYDYNKKLNNVKENKIIGKTYFLASFSNLDYVAEASSILKDINFSCLFKDKNKYILIFTLTDKDKDFLFARVSEFTSNPIKEINELQMFYQLEYAKDIIFKENAVKKLNNYIFT